jgi:hypothetical protein
MINHGSDIRTSHALTLGTERAILVCGLVFATAGVGGRCALAESGASPTGYAQSELRRASRDNPAETRSRTYATDELGRAIVTRGRSVPLYHTSNGQPIVNSPSAGGHPYIGFDGRPLDNPFRLGTGQLLLTVNGHADAGYYGSNGQPIEFEAGVAGVYGSNGAPIDPAMLNGVPLSGTMSSVPVPGEPAAVRTDATALGGNGLFRGDRVKRHGTVAVDATEQQEQPNPFSAGRRLLSRLSDNDAKTDDEPILSPLLPLLNDDEEVDWFESFEVEDREPRDRSENVPASYEQPTPDRSAFGMSRNGVTGWPFHTGLTGYSGTTRYFGRAISGHGSGANSTAENANPYRWPGHSRRGSVLPSGGNPASRTLGRSFSSR